MQVYYGIGQLAKARPRLNNVVAALGVFDGVHLGHQEIIRHAVTEARNIKGVSLVVTFHPHPVAVLHPERFSPYITSLSQRLECISELGVKGCLVVSFSRRFAAMRPVDFVRRYLISALSVKKVVVGDDFHFGHDRAGSIRLLEAQGRRYGFTIDAQHLKKLKHINIKSSYVRQRLTEGDVRAAADLLGRPYAIRGKVVHGDGRGRRLGFPTANLVQENAHLLPSGIYFAWARVGRKRWAALYYLGSRPSFKSACAAFSPEVYLLDYRGNLYGRTIEVEVLRMLRSDLCFPDEQSLIRQIRNDESAARSFFFSLRDR